MGGLLNKKSVSALVATVLLILITVAATGIIWSAVMPMITKSTKMSEACLNAKLSIDTISGYTCYDENKRVVNIMIKRGAEKFNLSGVQISLVSSGKTKSYYIYDDSAIILNMPFDEGSGAIVTDMSGKGNNGTIVGSAVWTNGRYDKALGFNGLNSRVDLSDKGSFDFNNTDFTISAWFKLDSYYGRPTVCNQSPISANDDYGWKLLVGGIGSISFNYYTSASASSGVGAITTASLGQWYHVSVVFSLGENKTLIYVNGTLENQNNITKNNIYYGGGDQPHIGAITGCGGQDNLFNGTIDEFVIWKRALTSDEIRKLYSYTAMEFPVYELPLQNEAKTYNLIEESITEASVAPVIKVGNTKKVCDITSMVQIPRCAT